jgi:hypothetical protein
VLDLFGAFGQIDLGRSAADIVAGRVRLTFGGTTYTLPVRSIKANREWKESLDERLAGLLSVITTAGGDVASVLAMLGTATGPMLDALSEYDHTHVLPPRADLEDLATEMEIVRAIAEVWLAANPLVVIAANQVTKETTTTPSPASGSSAPTSSPQPSTAGRRRRSKKG